MDYLGVAELCVTLVITVPLTVIAVRVSRSLSLRQGERDVRNSWLDFDLGLLVSKDVRMVADQMMHDGGQYSQLTSREQALWRWICYAVRNPLENFYEALARRHRWSWSKPVCCDSARYSLFSCLDQLVHDDTFMDIVTRFSADRNFVVLCRSVRERRHCDGDPRWDEPPRRRVRHGHECDALYVKLDHVPSTRTRPSPSEGGTV